MNKLDELTIGEARQLAGLFQNTNTVVSPTPFELGKSYFIRTVTYHLIGQLISIEGDFLILKDASWVADSGRFMQAIRDGVLAEVEPVGEAFVHVSSITDAFPWKHPLPKEQK